MFFNFYFSESQDIFGLYQNIIQSCKCVISKSVLVQQNYFGVPKSSGISETSLGHSKPSLLHNSYYEKDMSKSNLAGKDTFWAAKRFGKKGFDSQLKVN